MSSSSSSSSSPASPYPSDPSDVNVKEFVTVKLCEANYFTWRSMMFSLIQSYGLVRFATGTTNKNDETREKLLRGWIIATIEDEDFLVLVKRLETTTEIFYSLEDKFTQPLQPEILGSRGITTGRIRVAMNNYACKYKPLMEAALNGDWEKARKFFKEEPDGVRAIIGGASETTLMVAVRSVQRNNFLRKLVDMMTPVDLAMVDFSGLTSLHMAARLGNVEAAKLLVKKNPQLPDIGDTSSYVPLHMAARCGKREMVLYLYSITNEHGITSPFGVERGSVLVRALITSGFYDIALEVIERFPGVLHKYFSPLRTIAGEPSAFPSGIHFNFWQRWIYSC